MENQNSVCFIATIKEVRAIPNADNIELVIAGGWNAITKKGEFKEGDLTVIATTDAVIPESLSEEMGVTSYLRKGNRVRTVKLRGVYSECLIIPMKHLSGKVTMGDWDLGVGGDCMGFLGITKYEPPVKQIQLTSGRKIIMRKESNIKYGIIFTSALIIEICSTFYIRFTAEANTVGMVVFAFIGPFLALPFAGYMVESKFWNERIRMAFALALGYALGALIVNTIKI